MKVIIKTSLFAISIAMLFSIPNSYAVSPRECREEFHACLAANFPNGNGECQDAYYYCLYGYLPAKSAATPVADRRRD